MDRRNRSGLPRLRRLRRNLQNTGMARRHNVDAILPVQPVNMQVIRNEDVVDVDVHYLNSSPCIDLTNDNEVVDLTSPSGVNDSSVIILNSPRDSPPLTRRTLRSNHSDDVEIVLPNLDLSEVFDVSANESIASPARKIVCPVCLDDDKKIARSGRQLNSTVCGHIFCNQCIRAAIQSQHRCPTCRKNLRLNQVHPIFISF